MIEHVTHVIMIPEPRLFFAMLCIGLAALLAVLVLNCDRDGNLRAR